MDEPGSRRGRAHNAEAARKAILDAAEEVFAEHGFDGARIDLIAARSGYNKSLIFQYYEDKLNLYAGVIRRADDQTREMQNQAFAELRKEGALSDAGKLKRLLGQFIGAYFDYMVVHPNFMRILNWEMAEGWQTYAKILTERDFQDMNEFEPILEKIAKGGFLRTPFSPMAQLIMAMFTNHTYQGVLPFFKMFLPDFAVESSEAQAQAREFLISFVTHGLIADQPEVKT